MKTPSEKQIEAWADEYYLSVDDGDIETDFKAGFHKAMRMQAAAKVVDVWPTIHDFDDWHRSKEEAKIEYGPEEVYDWLLARVTEKLK